MVSDFTLLTPLQKSELEPMILRPALTRMTIKRRTPRPNNSDVKGTSPSKPELLTKLEKKLADLSSEWVPALVCHLRGIRGRGRGGHFMAAAKKAKAWRGILEGESVSAAAIDHY